MCACWRCLVFIGVWLRSRQLCRVVDSGLVPRHHLLCNINISRIRILRTPFLKHRDTSRRELSGGFCTNREGCNNDIPPSTCVWNHCGENTCSRFLHACLLRSIAREHLNMGKISNTPECSQHQWKHNDTCQFSTSLKHCHANMEFTMHASERRAIRPTLASGFACARAICPTNGECLSFYRHTGQSTQCASGVRVDAERRLSVCVRVLVCAVCSHGNCARDLFMLTRASAHSRLSRSRRRLRKSVRFSSCFLVSERVCVFVSVCVCVFLRCLRADSLSIRARANYVLGSATIDRWAAQQISQRSELAASTRILCGFAIDPDSVPWLCTSCGFYVAHFSRHVHLRSSHTHCFVLLGFVHAWVSVIISVSVTEKHEHGANNANANESHENAAAATAEQHPKSRGTCRFRFSLQRRR